MFGQSNNHPSSCSLVWCNSSEFFSTLPVTNRHGWSGESYAVMRPVGPVILTDALRRRVHSRLHIYPVWNILLTMAS
jgi:hypothetical protein